MATDSLSGVVTWRTIHLLVKQTIAQMQKTHPQLKVVTFPGIGPPPALMAEEQINLIQEWLLSVISISSS